MPLVLFKRDSGANEKLLYTTPVKMYGTRVPAEPEFGFLESTGQSGPTREGHQNLPQKVCEFAVSVVTSTKSPELVARPLKTSLRTRTTPKQQARRSWQSRLERRLALLPGWTGGALLIFKPYGEPVHLL